MHPLLARQIRRIFGATCSAAGEWERLLEVVDRTYRQADEDRALLERSLELTSQELLQKNQWLRDDNDRLEARVAERTERLQRSNTDLRNEIAQREAAELQLRQAQKMEAVGQLAGGVAHDINNQLSVILGYAALAQRDLPPGHAVRGELARIREAGEKSADIARQLLAFSRKQLLSPKVIDPHAVIARTERILARLLGENITITLVRRRPARCTRVDPGQLEQVVMNLAINARDAMPDGGAITIETGGASVDADRVAGHPGVEPGEFASVVLTDTGHGMDAGTLASAFDPFFTTKAEGVGTGLGLAMVHGFVYQSGGFIEVESAPGDGATFRLFFPAVEAEGEAHWPEPEDETALPGGHESVLVVEDDDLLREVVVRVLGDCGYRVAGARDGTEALELLAADPPDVLLSDVVMPGMSGVALAAQARALHPGIRVCLMSGYPSEAGPGGGIHAAGDRFLPKPITPGALACTVRELLS